MFGAIKRAGVLVEGSDGAAAHPAMAPQPGEPVVVKRRVGAFSTTDLGAVLRARGVTHLVLLGVSTRHVAACLPRESMQWSKIQRVGPAIRQHWGCGGRSRSPAACPRLSGVILSTVRDAADADYKITVIEDCCTDGASAGRGQGAWRA